MARAIVAVLLCAAVAAVAARELKQTPVALTSLPESLQQLNARMSSMATTSSVKPSDYLKYYYKSYDKYDKYEKEEKYYKEEPKYYKEEKYGYEPKYEKEEKYYKEKEYGYEPKYGYDNYGYGPSKIVVKLHEKYRSALRPQDTNNATFQFTSELTCQTNKDVDYEADYYKDEGIKAIPIAADHTKIVTVGVCEWTVSKVAEQEVTAEATLKGSYTAICTFNAEAERHCKHGEVLTKGLTLSAQGLVYEFEQKDSEEVDVFLGLVNSVVNSEHLKLDNGAIQFYYGAEGKKAKGEEDPTGELTIVFKH